jgi:mRNA interferase RelE/StbE
LSWVIEYDPAVLKDFKRIDRPDQRFILDSLDRFINNYSLSYVEALIRSGRLKRLHGDWKGYYRLRLRSYRVIYREYSHRLLILVVRVGHRRDVYE